jgi:hypothetical protein
MSTCTFYADLPPLEKFVAITDPQNFVPVPADWLIVITDIVGSTQAIAQGRYKDINLLGACSIVAVLNVATDLDVPFVFGGDGATLLIPPSLRSATAEALLATQAMARSSFNLDLRVGIVPVSAVRAAGDRIRIAKLRMTASYSQAVFEGGGLTAAIAMVKHPDTGPRYQLPPRANPVANFAGLECRWQDVPSPHGETISLLVLATPETRHGIYKEVLDTIRWIYGDEMDLNPIAPDRLALTFDNQKLLRETKVRRRRPTQFQTRLYLLQIKLENLLGGLLMRFKLRLGSVDWGRYKQDVTTTTDYRKFDDMLRMVISGNAEQRQRLIQVLDQHYRAGRLVYGLHVSDRALLTCLVFERNGRQVHFVDGADGGYALAAKAMKSRAQDMARCGSAF